VIHRPRRGAPCAILALALAVPAIGRAAPPEPAPAPPAPAPPAEPATSRAAAMKKTGDRAMDALRYADAYAAYSDVYALTLDPVLLYNMGRALQALNRFPEALDRLEAFQVVAPPELLAKVPRLGELIADLRGRVTTLKVTSSVAGARLLVRSTVMSKLPLSTPLRLPAGKAEVEVEAEGYFPFHRTVDLPGGAEITLEATLFSKATTGLLVINASAPGSVVYVDGQKTGLAPVEINVPGGPHRLKVTNLDFRAYETTTVVSAGARKDVDVHLLQPLIVTRWWFWGGLTLVGVATGVIVYAATTERAPGRGDISPGQIPVPAAAKGITLLKF
jgi:hypothetical protein